MVFAAPYEELDEVVGVAITASLGALVLYATSVHGHVSTCRAGTPGCAGAGARPSPNRPPAMRRARFASVCVFPHFVVPPRARLRSQDP